MLAANFMFQNLTAVQKEKVYRCVHVVCAVYTFRL
jgi:hypothetical protein